MKTNKKHTKHNASSKKASSKKTSKKHTEAAQDAMLRTKDLAKRLNVSPVRLRQVLRAMPDLYPDHQYTRYGWESFDDPKTKRDIAAIKRGLEEGLGLPKAKKSKKGKGKKAAVKKSKKAEDRDHTPLVKKHVEEEEDDRI